MLLCFVLATELCELLVYFGYKAQIFPQYHRLLLYCLDCFLFSVDVSSSDAFPLAIFILLVYVFMESLQGLCQDIPYNGLWSQDSCFGV